MSSQTAEAPATEQTTAYFWIITAQTAGGVFTTVSNVFDAPGGMTRNEIYKQVRAYLTTQIGEEFTVLFWSLEPNQL
ncbi:hypothetical protein [Streptomyces silvisoli]|uniref:Uncharacterized protein n=1 Tax=Streptomyces silvisoli TaxID=3034235 RepID=A0ABT5ZEV7_9ACTN|nr:hypothetical protein [Streptomyces silvisoli]MDF3288359.1 hypothetical protein [Streptomyces silvisoli]